MHKQSKIFATGIIIFTALSFSAFFTPCLCAEKNWLEKGASVLESLQKDTTEDTNQTGLTLNEISKGFKEALQLGTGKVVSQLGEMDGFNADTNIHIPLPEKLNTVKSMLTQVGMSHLLSDLELKLNRAAEAATPKAKAIFLQSISDMTFEDVKSIYNGPENAATQYFQEKMSPLLGEEMRPIVKDSLSEVGAIKAYDNVMDNYKSLPLVPDVKANLTDYVITKGMDGIFYYIAREEAAIRQNPAKRTTDLLKRVFGTK
jgi:Protein of unknown function (DUF4197)